MAASFLKPGEKACVDCGADLDGRALRTERCFDCAERRNNHRAPAEAGTPNKNKRKERAK